MHGSLTWSSSPVSLPTQLSHRMVCSSLNMDTVFHCVPLVHLLLLSLRSSPNEVTWFTLLPLYICLGISSNGIVLERPFIHIQTLYILYVWASQVTELVKSPHTNAGDRGDAFLIPGSGRFPGERNGDPLQCSCLGNSMERGTWQATAHRVAKSWTQLIDWVHMHARVCVCVCMYYLGGASGTEPDCQCRRQTRVQSLDREDPLEKEMATHSRILAWRIPQIEESGRLHCSPWGPKSQTNLVTKPPAPPQQIQWNIYSSKFE